MNVKVDLSKKSIIYVAAAFLMLIFILSGPAEISAQINSFLLKEVEIEQSKILSEKEIDAVLEKYENREVAIQELRELTEELNKLYQKKGFLTAKAVLPKQKIENGKVRIELVEAAVGEIYVKENNNTKDEYILTRFKLKEDELLNINSLEEKLNYFNSTNDIKVRAELKAGEEFAETDIILNTSEPDNFQSVLFTDNNGQEQTGEIRQGIYSVIRSLSGYRDSLSLSFISAEGTNAGSIAYSLPINKKGGRLGIAYAENQTNIIDGAFESIDVMSDYNDFSISISQPLKVGKNSKLSASAALHFKESDSYFSDINLISHDIRSAVFNINREKNKNREITTVQHSLNVVEGLDDGENAYFKYKGKYQKQKLLSESTMLKYMGEIQLAEEKIISSEEYVLGGISSLRGYDEGVISGESGYLIQLELMKQITKRLNQSIFIDFGGVDRADLDSETLGSLGTASRIKITDNLSGDFVLGIPLNNDYDPILHFSAQLAF